MLPPVERCESQVLVGRQPIVDREGRLVAYELLFRGSDACLSANFADGAAATSNVILNTISEFGVDRVLGDVVGYVNVGMQDLDLDVLTILPPHRFALELLETIEFDDATIDQCKALHDFGFKLALDDVIDIDAIPPSMLELADVIKVDVSATKPADIERILAASRRYQCTALAEKIETHAQHVSLHAQGFDLFQGYFFALPELLSQRRLPQCASTLFALLKALADDPSITQLESLVKKSPLLLTRLMKLAHSAAYGANEPVAVTVREAITRVGTKTLGRWAELLLFASDTDADLASDPLFRLVAVRSRFMELMAKTVAPGNYALSDAAYQTGVYSLLHAVTGQTQNELLKDFSIPLVQRQAIEHYEGVLGQILCTAEGFDFGSRGSSAMGSLNISDSTKMALHCQATLGVALDVRA